jgi:hypothetical protein
VEQEKELWGRKFKLVSNGLDEAEVYSFVESLIEQYGSLAQKLDHLDSVASRLTAQYTDLSGGVPAGSRPPTSGRQTPPANGLGDSLDSERLDNLEALTSFAERTVIEAAKHARSIEAEAVERATAMANRIVTDALHQAGTQAAWVLSQPQPGSHQGTADTAAPSPATQQGNVPVGADLAHHLSADASPTISDETVSAANDLRQDVRNAMDLIGDMDADDAKVALESLYAKLAPLLDSIAAEPSIAPDDNTTGSAFATSSPDDTAASLEEAPEYLDAAAQTSDGSHNGIFHGTVELVLPPPVALDRMLQLHKQLKEMSHIDVLNLGGSVDNGITIRILLDSPVPLLQILEELPEADEVAEEPLDGGTKGPGRKGDHQDHVRRVVITSKA